ncbi:ComEA family DNA-binding protein [Nonomuraea sp. NBC_01738]|uniref:ComEA family DNA-binding protein n=1 Tax=Nonomuraea sp. NBC_01738 TaxID=2976003 RepID=UPI002E0DCD57|nr:ComEA family DNA-binding protein [Nonomuraea sp. NBC_01738]
MPAPDHTTEQAIATSRLRAIVDPDPEFRPPAIPQSFQAFRTAAAAQASPATDPGRSGLRALLILALLAVAAGAIYLWQSRPTPDPLPAPPPQPVTAGTPVSTPTAEVTVHVTGKVRKPGVYTLPAGSRVTDAVGAAGGIRPGAPTGTVNLARRLIDGEQIAVGAPGITAAAPPTDPTATIIDLNTATATQLEALPGVGEVLAARIADYRTTHGGFRSVDQLKDVSGIGPRTYDELKDKVRV